MDNLKFLVIPFPSVQKHHHLHILFISLLMLVLAGCSSSENEQEKSAVNINLTNKNIVSFSQRISDDYFTNINALFQAYQKAALSDKPHEFVNYRNGTWTDNYISKKNYYSKVYETNEKFIISSPIKPLFEEFENLIYIGLDLKNGLLNADQARISNAYSETKQAKLKINSIRQQLGLPPLK
jgi:hypothetical protein